MTSIFVSSFPTSLGIPSQTFYYPIHTNIFIIYFPNNSSLLKFFSSVIFNFFYYLTFAFSLSSNFATTFFAFSKFSFLFYGLYSAINSFHYTRYFVIFVIFLLLNIFPSSTSTNFISSAFYPFTCFLYCTI